MQGVAAATSMMTRLKLPKQLEQSGAVIDLMKHVQPNARRFCVDERGFTIRSPRANGGISSFFRQPSFGGKVAPSPPPSPPTTLPPIGDPPIVPVTGNDAASFASTLKSYSPSTLGDKRAVAGGVVEGPLLSEAALSRHNSSPEGGVSRSRPSSAGGVRSRPVMESPREPPPSEAAPRQPSYTAQAGQQRGICFVNVKANSIPEEEHSFLAEVALKLRRKVYAPKERLVPDGLQIIMKGIVGQNGDILRQGDVFGIDMIISSEELRDTRPITCISYVEVAALSREDLEEVRSNFPTVSGILHKAAMVLALGNAMPHAASHKAARACPFPLGGLHGKVRQRWAAALAYTLNASKEPLAVRRERPSASRRRRRCSSGWPR